MSAFDSLDRNYIESMKHTLESSGFSKEASEKIVHLSELNRMRKKYPESFLEGFSETLKSAGYRYEDKSLWDKMWPWLLGIGAGLGGLYIGDTLGKTSKMYGYKDGPLNLIGDYIVSGLSGKPGPLNSKNLNPAFKDEIAKQIEARGQTAIPETTEKQPE